MFETSPGSRSGLFWKVMVGVGLTVGAVAAAAIALYEPEPEEPAKPLVGILHKGDPDYSWYRQHLELRDPRVKMAKNLAGKRMVIFSGVLENNGEKALDVVEVKLAFSSWPSSITTSMSGTPCALRSGRAATRPQSNL